MLDDLYAMGDIALHMVKDAIAAYVQVDLSAAAQVIARDDDCDAMFSRISKEIAAYIAAHPSDAETALDLFMIDKYLERLGDHAVNLRNGSSSSRPASTNPARSCNAGINKPFSYYFPIPTNGLPKSGPRLAWRKVFVGAARQTPAAGGVKTPPYKAPVSGSL